MAKIHGGQIVARALKALGTDVLFTLTGGHIVAILDGCVQEGIRVVDVRHEQTAAHAAEAYTRLTGRLGVAAVTAGPGVTDAITGVATAHSAGTPMLLIGGRHLLRQELMGGLQEMNHPPLFEGITKWAGTAWQTHRLAEYVMTAARHAFAGRGGPAFLDIPMDVQLDMVDEDSVLVPEAPQPHRGGVDGSTLTRIVEALAAAESPTIFAGAASPGVTNRLVDLAEALGAPTYTNGRARGSLPYGHPLLGNHARTSAFAGADLVLALGVDWDFRTGYGQKVADGAVVIQIDAEPTKIGWNRSVTIGAVADPMAVVSQLVSRADEFTHPHERTFTRTIMDEEATSRASAEDEAANDSSPVSPQRFARDVAAFLGSDSIVAVDGGDIVSTTARWLQTSHPGHVLDPGPFGSLGTGPPYAIAAKVAFPDARVGIIFGDGGFGFNGMEYDTMVRLGLPIIGVMGNDGVWSNIKTVHRMFYPDRLVATDLGVRPYHAMVEGLGGHGELVTDPAEIAPALKRAEASGKPALVNVHIAETMRMSSNYSQ
jgi:acetolactate synthase I/II/III large subunit